MLLAVIGITGTALLFPLSQSIHATLESLHGNLMFPGIGAAIVIVATAAAVLLEFSGLYLWWKRRSWAVRWRAGLRLAAYDLHNVLGALLLAVMLLLAVTGLARIAVREALPQSPRVIGGMNALHTGRIFPAPVRVVYGIGSAAFLVQGLTGVIMWWPLRGRSSAVAGLTARG